MPVPDNFAAASYKYIPDCIYAAFSFGFEDDLILTDAGYSFCKITGCGKEHLGRYITEIFNEEYSAHLRGKAYMCRNNPDGISYFVIGGENCFIWRIEAKIRDGCFICTGEKLRRFPTELFCASDIIPSPVDYLGAALISCEKNNVSAVSISSSLTERFGENFFRSDPLSLEMLKSCAESRAPACYYDIFRRCEDSEYEPVQIIMLPAAGEKRSPECLKAPVMFYRVRSEKAVRFYDAGGIAAAYSEINGDRILFSGMNLRFAYLLGKSRRFENELYSAVKGAFLGADGKAPPCFGFRSDMGFSVCVFPSENEGEAYIAAAEKYDVIGKLRKPCADLTETEYKAMALAAKGDTDKVIALSLKISESFVKKALRKGCKKLGAENRVSLARIFRSVYE